MFGAIAGGIASALAGGAMSKLFGGGQKAASGGIQGDVLATDNNTVGMVDAGIKSAIQGSNVPNPDEAVPSFVSGAMAIRANTISFTVFPEIVPSIGNSFINTMKNINHTRSSISDDIRNILCSSANMRRAIPLILRLLMN